MGPGVTLGNLARSCRLADGETEAHSAAPIPHPTSQPEPPAPGREQMHLVQRPTCDKPVWPSCPHAALQVANQTWPPPARPPASVNPGGKLRLNPWQVHRTRHTAPPVPPPRSSRTGRQPGGRARLGQTAGSAPTGLAHIQNFLSYIFNKTTDTNSKPTS